MSGAYSYCRRWGIKDRNRPITDDFCGRLKLLQLSNDENAQAKDLSRIIATDPALTARILKVVNSAAYGLPHKILSINHALSILGFSAIRRIATEQLLYNQLIKNSGNRRFNQLYFWQHCLFVACLSKQIAIQLKYPDPDVIYTGGLLHDIGKIVLEGYGKVSYSDFLLSSDKSACATEHCERAFFGLTHAEIGYVLCLKWDLPPVITAVVGFHHALAPEHSPYSQFGKEAAIICFADYIAWLHGIGSGKGAAGPSLPEEVSLKIDFSRLNFESLLQTVDREMQNTAKFYRVEFPDIQKIRATLVYKAITLGNKPDASPNPPSYTHNYLASLTSPHLSLEPHAIVLATLEAIHSDFNFSRVIMFGMAPNRQGLIAKHCWPQQKAHELLIPIAAIGGELLQCLRNRTVLILDQASDSFGQALLKLLQVDCFIAVPVLQHKQLIGVLYADYGASKFPISEECAGLLLPVANQLGVALLNAKRYSLTKKQAEMDTLSQLFNKGKVNQLLAAAYQQAPSLLTGFAVGFVDIDHFKKFNDVCGHQAGDDAIRIVAEILRSMSRPEDFVGRYGGEEFLFALHHTHREGAFGFAERMRLEIEKRGLLLSPRFNNLALTVSIGVALYKAEFSTYRDQVQAADKAMYLAKNQGRNRVVLVE